MPKRILLADDSITIQKVVELTFSDGDYEVTAVNNGAKAIQKLSEMRPDIILSDIIMPEKNGYEVCEYVKSHPDFRNLPVILLTGTFEPFDPDRADKAGCDAVVTKPFESQSLIQKVEELIAASKAAAPAAAAPAPAQPPQPFSTAAFPPSAPAAGFQPHGSEIFAAPAAEMPPPAPMPFAPPAAAPAFGGETRAFPPMSFGDLAAPASTVPPPPPMESSPWDEPAEKEPASSGMQSGFSPLSSSPAAPAAPEPSPWDEPVSGGETRAFGKMSFDDLQKMAAEPASSSPAMPPPTAEPSPWDAPEGGSGETRAMPRMSFDELQSLSKPAASQPETSPWDQPAPASDAGATNAFPPLNFGGFNAPPAMPESPIASSESMWGSSEPSVSSSDAIPFGGGHVPEPEPVSEPSPWDAPHEEFSGETTALPKMSFDDLRKVAEPEHHAPEPEAPSSPSWTEEPPQAPSWPSDAQSESRAHGSAMAGGERADDLPAAFGSSEAAEPAVEAKGTPGTMADHSDSHEWAAPAPPMAAGGERAGDLSDDQIDRIARRVVQLMSDTVVRNIAWEVIPDLAEMVVKERIRQLESE